MNICVAENETMKALGVLLAYKTRFISCRKQDFASSSSREALEELMSN